MVPHPLSLPHADPPNLPNERLGKMKVCISTICPMHAQRARSQTSFSALGQTSEELSSMAAATLHSAPAISFFRWLAAATSRLSARSPTPQP